MNGQPPRGSRRNRRRGSTMPKARRRGTARAATADRAHRPGGHRDRHGHAFGGVAVAAWIGGEVFLAAMGAIGCLMTAGSAADAVPRLSGTVTSRTIAPAGRLIGRGNQP